MDTCEECKQPTRDKYRISPITGGRPKNKVWCKDCYETLLRKESARRYGTLGNQVLKAEVVYNGHSPSLEE